jgi:hypothetical protein
MSLRPAARARCWGSRRGGGGAGAPIAGNRQRTASRNSAAASSTLRGLHSSADPKVLFFTSACDGAQLPHPAHRWGSRCMRIPSAATARIAREKLRDYVLSLEHPVGRAKAAWLLRLGYTRAGWRTLREDLRQHLKLDASQSGPWPIRDQIHRQRPPSYAFRPDREGCFSLVRGLRYTHPEVHNHVSGER